MWYNRINTLNITNNFTSWYPSVLPMQQQTCLCYFKHQMHLLASFQAQVGKNYCTVLLRIKLDVGPHVGGWAQLLLVPTPPTRKSGAGELGQENTPWQCHVMELTPWSTGTVPKSGPGKQDLPPFVQKPKADFSEVISDDTFLILGALGRRPFLCIILCIILPVTWVWGDCSSIWAFLVWRWPPLVTWIPAPVPELQKAGVLLGII